MVNVEGIEVFIKLASSGQTLTEFLTKDDPEVCNEKAKKTVRYIQAATSHEFSIVIRIHEGFELRSAHALQVTFSVDGYEFEHVEEFSRDELPEQLGRLVTREIEGDRLYISVDGKSEERMVKQSFAKATTGNPTPVGSTGINEKHDDRGTIRITCTRVLTTRSRNLCRVPRSFNLEGRRIINQHTARSLGLTHYVKYSLGDPIERNDSVSHTRPCRRGKIGVPYVIELKFRDRENLKKLELWPRLHPKKRLLVTNQMVGRNVDSTQVHSPLSGTHMDVQDSQQQECQTARLKRRLGAPDNEGHVTRKRAKATASSSYNPSGVMPNARTQDLSATAAAAAELPDTFVRQQQGPDFSGLDEGELMLLRKKLDLELQRVEVDECLMKIRRSMKAARE